MGTFKTALTVTTKIYGTAPFLFEGAFADGVARAASLGYDAVELHINDVEELSDAGLRKALDAHGLCVSSIGTGRLYVNKGLSLTDPDAGVRREAMRQLRLFLDAASELHSIVILGCIRGNIPAPEERESVVGRLGESMTELDRIAGEMGVDLVLEAINRYENNYLVTLGETRDFLTAYKLTHTGILMDTFHMNIEESDLCGAIRDAGQAIRHVHIADSNRHYPGGGHLDFPAIFRSLQEIGYSGTLSAECLPIPTKEEAQQKWIATVKELLA